MDFNIQQHLDEIITECINEIVDENRVVTFGNATYPNFGWCVVLAGGGGSGKGFVASRLLPINAKTINVDDFKKMYVKLRQGKIDGEDYDSKNPQHVSNVHMAVKKLGWKDKIMRNTMSPETHSPDKLPNVVFDMTGDKPNISVAKIAMYAKQMGYNTMLVWVVANRHEALLRNLQRPRRVGDEIMHQKHNALATQMPPFLQSSESVSYLDDAWIVFNSTEGIKQSDLTGDEAKTAAVRLQRTESGFVIDNETQARLSRYLGRMETDPANPKVYMSSDEIAAKYGTKTKKTDIKPNFNDFSNPKSREREAFTIDRSKVPDNFYRKD